MSLDAEVPPGATGSDGSDHPPKTSPETSQPLSREKVARDADNLIRTRVGEIAKKYSKIEEDKQIIDDSKMSDDEFNLYSVELYRAGFTDEEYKYARDDGKDGIELRGGLEVTTIDGQKVNITSLLSEEDSDGKKVYKARTEIDDPDNPGTTKKVEVSVEADEVVRSHMAKRADSIAANFADTRENVAVRWHASGSTDDPPEAVREVTEQDVDSPIAVADEIISTEKTNIQRETNNLRSKDKLTPAEKETLARNEQVLGKIKLLTEVNGEDFVELARLEALLILETNGVEGLTDLQEQLEPGAQRGLKILQDKLVNEGGATDSDLALIENQGFSALMTNPDLLEKALKVKDINKLVFGREIPDEEAISMFGGALNDKQRKWLDNMIKTGKIGGGILAIILLTLAAIPATALYVGATSQKR